MVESGELGELNRRFSTPPNVPLTPKNVYSKTLSSDLLYDGRYMLSSVVLQGSQYTCSGKHHPFDLLSLHISPISERSTCNSH